MIIGDRIREAREHKNLTQGSLGKLIGVSKVSICGYETGTRTPKMHNFLDLAKVLEIDVNYIVGNDIVALKENCEEYGVKIATVDMQILDAIKQSRELYNKFCTNPDKTVQQILETLKI